MSIHPNEIGNYLGNLNLNKLYSYRDKHKFVKSLSGNSLT